MKDKELNKYLRKRLKENPNLDVAQYKRGWYSVGRRIRSKSK